MGPEGEKIMETAYALHISETGESITFDEFFDKIVSDEEFGKYFDGLYNRAKEIRLKQISKMRDHLEGSEDWVYLIYTGESYEIMEGVIFEKGTRSGMPKSIWLENKDKFPDWVEI